MFKNIVLDWSGTIADDLEVVVDATNAVMRAYGGSEFTRETFKASFYLPYTEWYKDVIPNAPTQELEEVFREAFAKSEAHVVPLEASEAFLQWCLQQKIRVFILSSVHEPALVELLEEYGWTHYFEAIYGGITHKEEKLAEMMKHHGLLAQETAFVGDMVHDIDTGNANGVTSVGLWSGYQTPQELAEANADVLFADIGKFANWLQKNGSFPLSTVGGLLKREDGKYLFLKTHKWQNLWGIPGGKINLGESAEQALSREVLEETNQVVTSSSFVISQDCVNHPEFYKPAHFVLLNYVMEIEAGREVVLNDEAEEFQWLTLEEAKEIDLNTPTRILVDEVLKRG